MKQNTGTIQIITNVSLKKLDRETYSLANVIKFIGSAAVTKGLAGLELGGGGPEFFTTAAASRAVQIFFNLSSLIHLIKFLFSSSET